MANLIYKWLKSENASSTTSKQIANKTMKALNMSPRQYRKMLSEGRKRLDVVERKMSSDNWQAINYETVPSKANLLYKNAFLRHDTERRYAYIEGLQRGDAKINSSVSFPHEIVQEYIRNISYFSHYYDFSDEVKYDQILESMWSSLPNMVDKNNSTLVVSDGSGSMTCTIPGTNTMCWTVSQAIAMYFAERCEGAFKNKFITFSSRPELVDLGKCGSLREKILEMVKHDDCSNTNIEATFDLILDTAVRHRMDQSELPKNVLIISDMQFDSAVSFGSNRTLFEIISDKFEKVGYRMPKLIFWNVNCRNTGKTIPVTQNENGVVLISGFSVNLCKMVMSDNTDPFDCLVDTLNSSRYDTIEEICKKIWRIAV